MATKTRTVTKYVARPKRSFRRAAKSSRKLPLAILFGLAPGFTFAFDNPEHDSRQFFERLGWEYFGFVGWEGMPRFDSGGFRYGLYPLLASVGVHWLANITGINRAISKIPFRM